MLQAFFVDDIATAFSDGEAGGITVPSELADVPRDRLRLVDKAVVDAASFSTFFVDDQGRKHVAPGEKRQKVSCSYDDTLRRVGGVWQVGEDDPPSAPVPPTISDRQFVHGLWKQNVVTFEEAKAFLKNGELPADLVGLLASLPASQREDAELLLTGATVFERHHPFTAALSSAFGWTEEVTDEFWRFAAAL